MNKIIIKCSTCLSYPVYVHRYEMYLNSMNNRNFRSDLDYLPRAKTPVFLCVILVWNFGLPSPYYCFVTKVFRHTHMYIFIYECTYIKTCFQIKICVALSLTQAIKSQANFRGSSDTCNNYIHTISKQS
jgi:hypothetical protein